MSFPVPPEEIKRLDEPGTQQVQRPAAGEGSGIRFFAVPGRFLAQPAEQLSPVEMLEPQLSIDWDVLEGALADAQLRDIRARDRVRALLSDGLMHGSPGRGWGRSAVFAQPPQDLPALLRLADEIERLTRQKAGERALVWNCAECGTRYAVPIALARPVSIRCERCGKPVDLFAEHSLGEESLVGPFHRATNAVRLELARFFREAMARGWPVLVCQATR
jgi:DNA-directed RNA polymerase subunit RPC12/RpoP